MELGWGFVDEVPGLLKPEPATERELEAMDKISHTDYAIYTEKLGLICEEAKEIFVRSGRAAMLLAGDLIVGVYTAGGDLVTGMAGAYIHAVTSTPAIKYILRRWKDDPTVGLKEGDIWINSDPLYGGLHPPDMAMVFPFYANGELIAWIGAAVHEGDTGAIGPAISPLSKSRFEQGITIPPLKIGENYHLRQDILHLISNHTRTPESLEVDIRARAAACDRVRIRFNSIVEEKGADFLVGLLHLMVKETERGAKARIKEWNDGKYRGAIFFDSVGLEEGLVKVSLTVEKKGDHLTFDFTETSPENYSSWNSFSHMGIAHAVNVLYWGVFSELPTSTGIFAAIDWKFKPGSFLHAGKWASTMLAPPALVSVMVLVEICFSKLMYAYEPDRKLVIAGTGSQGNMSFSAMNQWGFHVADLSTIFLNGMGGGARHDKDGVHSFFFAHCPWGKAMDVEDTEIEIPFLHLNASHLPDQGGFGHYRGGSGTSLTLMTHLVPAGALMSWGAGTRVPQTLGIFGGYPAPGAPTIQTRNTTIHERMKRGDIVLPATVMELAAERAIDGDYVIGPAVGKVMGLFSKGEIYAQTRAGGGGYGDVLEREPDMVIKDLRDKAVSHWVAQNVYKVAYDLGSLEVDYKKTEELRQKEREDRKKKGKRYEEFEKEWQAKRPPEEALAFYGSWPDGAAVKPIMRI